MSNRLTSEPEWDWTLFKACFSLPALPPKRAATPEAFFTQAHKASLYFVSSDKGKINTWVTFVQHTVHCSDEKKRSPKTLFLKGDTFSIVHF